MLRQLWVSIVLVLGAGAASAVSLTVSPDKLTYTVGETVTLTVIGDPENVFDQGLFGRLEYPAALTDTLTSSQTQHTSRGGAIFAVTGTLLRGDGFADVFNQIVDGDDGHSVDQIQIATATLLAEAPGVVTVSWRTAGPFALDFFGLTSAPGASFTIVPEPAAALLLGLGMLALAAWRRRRA